MHAHIIYIYTHTHTHILGFPLTQFYRLSRAVSQCPAKFGLGNKCPRPLQLMIKLLQQCTQTFGLPTAGENVYYSHQPATNRMEEEGLRKTLR